MKIEEAILILEKPVHRIGDGKEVKVKQRFSNILNELKTKDLSPSQKARLGKELNCIFSEIDAGTEINEQQLRKGLKRFLKFLRNEFSLIPEGYYAGYGMAFGIISGLFLLSFLILYTESPWKFYAPLLGAMLGMLLGTLKDAQIRKQGKTLLTRMY